MYLPGVRSGTGAMSGDRMEDFVIEETVGSTLMEAADEQKCAGSPAWEKAV